MATTGKAMSKPRKTGIKFFDLFLMPDFFCSFRVSLINPSGLASALPAKRNIPAI